MTLTEQNKSYSIQETLDNGWNVSGTLSINADNSSINGDLFITDPSSPQNNIGNFHWNNYNRTSGSYEISNDLDELETLTIFLNTAKKVIETYKSL